MSAGPAARIGPWRKRVEDLSIRLKILLGLVLVGVVPFVALSALEIGRHGGRPPEGPNFAALLVSLGLLLSIAAAGALTQLILRPLRDLQEGVEGLMTGAERKLDVGRADEIGRLAVAFDALLAERHAAEAERAELLVREQRALADAEAAKEVGRLKSAFVSAISHELRTPLTSIVGYAEFLEDEIAGGLAPEQAEYVRQIQLGTRRLRLLVDDLLDAARMDAGTFKLALSEADFGEKVREVVESLKPQADEAKLTMSVELPEQPLVLTFDAQRIEQVLINLIGNAIKFTEAGGRIIVRADFLARDLRCEVVDTGIGIQTEDIPKLFQRFSQLEPGVRHVGGTGLGLSISKALVEAHGGKIGVESMPGGSTFWFTLPHRPAEAGPDGPRTAVVEVEVSPPANADAGAAA